MNLYHINQMNSIMPPQNVDLDAPDKVSKANQPTNKSIQPNDGSSNDIMSVVVSSSFKKKKKHPWIHVNFPPANSLITAIHTRPRTDIHDIPTLYYSSDEIKRFKQNYKDQFLVRCCEQQEQKQHSLTAGEIRADQFIRYDSCSMTHHPPTNGRQRQQQSKQPAHDNTFWRTKVHRQWQSSSSSSASKTKIRNDNSNIENNGTAAAEEESYSYGDLLNYKVPVDRIVFGMSEASSSLTISTATANEAGTKGASSSSSSLSLVSKKKCHHTSLQLVDNLYLF